MNRCRLLLAAFAATALLTTSLMAQLPVRQAGYMNHMPAQACHGCAAPAHPYVQSVPCPPPGLYGSHCCSARTIVGELLWDIRNGVHGVVRLVHCAFPPIGCTAGCYGDPCCSRGCGPRLLCLPLPRIGCLLPPLCGQPCYDACCDGGFDNGMTMGEGTIVHERIVPAQPTPSTLPPPDEQVDPFRDEPTTTTSRRPARPPQLQRAAQPVAVQPTPAMRSVVKRTTHAEPAAQALQRLRPNRPVSHVRTAAGNRASFDSRSTSGSSSLHFR